MKIYVNLVTGEGHEERPHGQILSAEDPALKLVRRVAEGLSETVGADVRYRIVPER